MAQSGSGQVHGAYVGRTYEGDRYAQEAGRQWGGDPAKVAGQYSVAEGRRLETAVETPFSDGFRPGLDSSDQDYRSRPHQELVSYVNDGVSPENVDERGRIVNDLGNAKKDVSDGFAQAAAKEELNWQGPAAEQAHGFLGALAKRTDSSGDAAALASNRYSQTSAALVNAPKNMPRRRPTTPVSASGSASA